MNIVILMPYFKQQIIYGGDCMNDQDKKKFKLGLLFAAAVIVIYSLITNFTSLGRVIKGIISILSPLLLGILLSLILGTPMGLFERFLEFLNKKSKFKKKLSEKAITMISLILAYLLAIGIISFVFIILIPAIKDSVNEIATAIKNAYPVVSDFIRDQGIKMPSFDKISQYVNLTTIWQSLTSNAGTIVDTVISSVNGIITLLANLVTMIIFSVYILANKKNLKRQSEKLVRAYFKEEKATKINYVINLVTKTFSNFFSGQCLEAIILGTIFFVVMSIFRFPYAPIISVVIGITAFIPYVGAFIGCIVGVILILLISPMKALIFAIMFLIIQQLENNIIYPRVVGTSVGLPAIWTFAALIVGGAVYGVVGMLVFIPLTSILHTLLRNDVKERLSKKEALKNAEPDNEENK